MPRRYRRHPDVVWREEGAGRDAAERGAAVGDDIAGVATSVLLRSGTMLSLNLVGTEIWKRCDGKTLDELVHELAAVFDVGPDEARSDLASFLADLDRQGFLDGE